MNATAKVAPRGGLPPEARAKLLRFEGESRDAAIAASSASSRMAELKKGLDYSGQPPDNLSAVEIELARLDVVRKAADRKHRSLADLVAQIQGWLSALPRHAVLEQARVQRATPQDGETLVQAIDKIREEIASVEDTLRLIQFAPPPKSLLKTQAEEQIEAMAKRGAPTLRAEAGGLVMQFGSGGVASTTNIADMLAWLHAGSMIAAVQRQIDKFPNAPHAMPPDEKERRLVDAKGNLEMLERREEALLENAIGQGIDVMRRPDAMPAAVLGVQFAKVKKAAAA